MIPTASPDVAQFFATSAGPDVSDLIGPPLSVFDMYGDGTPVDSAQSAVASGGGKLAWYQRPDIHGAILLGIGAVMIHMYANAE